jgi:uncharacterized protein YbbC (DUF1343 family)
MKKLMLICVLITTFSFAQKIKAGVENYTEYLSFLKGKNIAVVANQTGIIDNKTHLVDFLVEKKIKINKVFDQICTLM